MDERARRLWAGTEAGAIGWGGVAAVARATGMAISTVRKGRDEVRSGRNARGRRQGSAQRRQTTLRGRTSRGVAGAGEARRSGHARRPGVAAALDVQEHARAVRELFMRHGIRLSDKTVAKLLREHGYSLQAPNKSVEGAQHPDRNAQFEHINAKAQDCVERGVPVISVDTKKKELVGNFKNGGREWQPRASPSWWTSTTSRPMRSARRSRTASTTSPPTTASSASASTTTRRCSRSPRSRHGGTRWREALPRGARDLHHRRRGRQQRLPVARLEARAATRRRQARHGDPRQPLSARHQQVEQDRAPPLLVHLDQPLTSRSAPRRSRSGTAASSNRC